MTRVNGSLYVVDPNGNRTQRTVWGGVTTYKHDALDRLSPRQRAVVVLRFYDDQSVATVAQALGCSEGNVKKITHEALGRLRTLVPLDPDSDLLTEGSGR